MISHMSNLKKAKGSKLQANFEAFSTSPSKVLQSLKDVERSARSVENKYKKLLSQYDENIPVRFEKVRKRTQIFLVSHIQDSTKH